MTGLMFLRDKADVEDLESKVTDKNYFMFRHKEKTSRPINTDLFDRSVDDSAVLRILRGDVDGIAFAELQKLLYTSAMSYCATTDLTKTNDKKSPGTFFEIFTGHLVAGQFGVNPERHTEVPSLDIQNTLPTDYVFDLGPGCNRIHLPIKTSTRERVVQVWAHQRVLDGLHGTNRFKGLLVAMTETNKQNDSSVVEVCLPGQWAVYQMYIAQMHRIYYLDVPQKYSVLNNTYPFIHVSPFAAFFGESESIAKASPLA